MLKILVGAGIMAVMVTACGRTDEGDLEVERPVVGTVTDTLNIPSVDVSMDTAQVTVPNVDVRRDTATIRVPDVDVRR